MGLLDRYRRFEDLPAEEARAEARSRRRAEQARERVAPLDLSRTVSPTLPNTEVVNAAIAVARSHLNVYPDPRAGDARRAIAEHHGIEPERVTVGNGAAELLRGAAHALLGPEDQLLTPWPSYPLYPELAEERGASVVRIPVEDRGLAPDEVLAAVTERTRLVTISNPNDPTGAYLPSARLAELLEELPERTYVLLDEALAHFQTRESLDAGIALTEGHPRLLVFRSFSKVYGLSGLRGGYVVGSSTAGTLLASLTPALGVNAVTQTAMTYALRHVQGEIARRRTSVARERDRLLEGMRDLPIVASSSEANFVWLRAHDLSARDLADRLEASGILVASGERYGDQEHVRVAVRDPAATDRVLSALVETTSGQG